MLLLLNCIRRGDKAEMDPLEMYGWGLCSMCWSKKPSFYDRNDRFNPMAFHRFMDRWQRDMERHPTYKGLTAALDAMVNVPHATIVLRPPE